MGTRSRWESEKLGVGGVQPRGRGCLSEAGGARGLKISWGGWDTALGLKQAAELSQSQDCDLNMYRCLVDQVTHS